MFCIQLEFGPQSVHFCTRQMKKLLLQKTFDSEKEKSQRRMCIFMKGSRTLTQHQFDLVACQHCPSIQSLTDATRTEHHKNTCMPLDTLHARVSEHPFRGELMKELSGWFESPTGECHTWHAFVSLAVLPVTSWAASTPLWAPTLFEHRFPQHAHHQEEARREPKRPMNHDAMWSCLLPFFQVPSW